MKKKSILKKLKKMAGFTLVELLVVTSLTVILMVASTSVFAMLIFTTNKTKIEEKIKNEGNNALSNMEFVLRNAEEVTSLCDGSPVDSLTIETINFPPTIIRIKRDQEKIAIVTNGVTKYITSSGSNLTGPNFICYTGENDVQYVDMEFSLRLGQVAAQTRESTIETFKSGVTIRN